MQHVDEAAHLRHVRFGLERAPHVRLLQLGRIDERIAAHLDGVAVAGEYGLLLATQALERPGAGQLFLTSVCAIQRHDAELLDKLLAVAEAVPPSRVGLLSAFGWVAASDLQGMTQVLVEASSPWRREVALAAYAMHEVKAGHALSNSIQGPNTSLRARALRVAGRSGCLDLLEPCLALLGDEDPSCAFEAARSAVLLGDRTTAVDALEALAAHPGADTRLSTAALHTVLKVVSSARARVLLASIAKDAGRIRAVIQGIGVAGDTLYVPWLIAQMGGRKLTRLAGEAFSFLTGLDLAYLDLDRKPLIDTEPDPNDDAEHEAIVIDEDDGLPWPDPEKVTSWWRENSARFAPGNRYFMGDVPTPASCVAVIKSGFQRQRIAAAEYRVLFEPGTPLFNTFAPTWRQERLLAKLL